MTRSNIYQKTESSSLPINRGVELILGEKSKRQDPNAFLMKFGKMISLFEKEIHLNFEFSVCIKKRSLGG